MILCRPCWHAIWAAKLAQNGLTTMYFELYQSSGQWRWRLKGGNHEIVAHGESYVSKQGALNAIQFVRGTNGTTPIYE